LRKKVIHHAACLHKRINDGRVDESEAYLFQILADFIGNGSGCGHILYFLSIADNGLVVSI